MRGTQVLSARVSVVRDEVKVTPPEILFEIQTPPPIFRRAPLAISRDGSRLVFPRAVEQPNSEVINISTAWDRR